MNMRKPTIIWIVLLATGTYAGSGGVQPDPENYGFFRTDPQPEEQVGSGNVDEEGTLTTDAGTPNEKTWKRGEDGQYRLSPQPGSLSICFQEQEREGCPYPYTFKLDNEPVHWGELRP